MSEHSIQEYITLINQLMECDESARHSLLQDHQTLLDSDLIGVIDKIVVTSQQQNNWELASYLHSLRRTIQREIDMQQEHLSENNRPCIANFLQALCHCEEGQEQAIYSRFQDCFIPENIAYLHDLRELFHNNGIHKLARKLGLILSQFNHDAIQRSQIETIPTIREQPVIPCEYYEAVDSSWEEEVAKLRQSISKLVQAINQQQPALQYLEILENAQSKNWLLSTHELGVLLGVKPHCAPSQKEYFKGGWKFIKMGKRGREILWQVKKLTPEEMTEEPNPSPQARKPNVDQYSIADPWSA